MSAPTLTTSNASHGFSGGGEVVYGLNFDCENQRFSEDMFDRDPVDQAIISSAAGLAVDGIRKVGEVGDPLGLQMVTEAQRQVGLLSPVTRVAFTSYVMASLVHIGCRQLDKIIPTHDGFIVTASMVRTQREEATMAFQEAGRDPYVPGKAAVNYYIASVVAEAMLDEGRPETTARDVRDGQTARAMLIPTAPDSNWHIDAQRRLSQAAELSKSRQRVYRAGVQEKRIATAIDCVNPGTSDIDRLLIPRS